MFLSDIGNIVSQNWKKINQIRKNISLDEFVIMPNHLHGIIIINYQMHIVGAPQWGALHIVRAPQWGAPTKITGTKRNPFWKPNSLGSIINQFKSACTKQIYKTGHKHFAWQRNYYEHIIRNEYELNAIREYIMNNPSNWNLDKNNPKTLNHDRVNPKSSYI